MTIAVVSSAVTLPAQARGARPTGLTYAELAKIERFNPYAVYSRSGQMDRFLTLIYEPLYRYNWNTWQWEGVLARSADSFRELPAPANESLWEIDLKPNVRWHDGTPFTYADVKFTLDYIVGDRCGLYRQQREYLRRVLKSVSRGSNDLQVRIAFKRKIADPREYLFNLIIPSSKFMASGTAPCDPRPNTRELEVDPLGTGPMRWEGPEAGGDRLALRAFDQYHSDRAQIPQVRMRAMSDAVTMMEELSARTRPPIDLVVEVPSELQVQYEERARDYLDFMQIPTYNIYALAMHQRAGSPLANVEVRRAISLAVDTRRLQQEKFPKARVPATIYAANSNFFDPELEPTRVNRQAASQVLAQARLPQRPFVLLYEADPSSAMRATLSDVAEILVSQLTEAGVRVSLQGVPPLEFKERLFEKGDWDFALVRWEFLPNYDVSDLLLKENAVPGGRNYMRVKDDTLESILSRMERTSNADRKIDLGKQLGRRIKELAPAVFLADEVTVSAFHLNRFRIAREDVDPFYYFTNITSWSIR